MAKEDLPQFLEKKDLDVRVEKIQGFQPFVDFHTIEVMKVALGLGHKFPRGDIVRTTSGIYQLLHGEPEEKSEDGSVEWNYGAHHRGVTHLVYERGILPFQANVWSNHRDSELEEGLEWKYLKDIEIRRTPPQGGKALPKSFLIALTYLPQEEIEKFCWEHHVDQPALSVASLVHFGTLSFEDVLNYIQKNRAEEISD